MRRQRHPLSCKQRKRYLKELVFPDVSNDVIRLRDLASGQTQTIVTGAALPALSWPWVTYTQGDGKGNADGIIKNLETNQTIPWHDEQMLSLQSIALRGHSLAYSLLKGNAASVKYIADFTQSIIPVTLASTGGNSTHFVDFVTMSDRLISWNNDPQLPSQVWDRKLNRLINLPVEAKGGAFALSTLMYWESVSLSADQVTELKKQGMIAPFTYNIIDTTTLP